MRSKNLYSTIVITAIAVGGSAAAHAAEVYRWVDENGVVHYSDAAPEQVDAETLVVRDATPPGYDPLTDPYSILNQAERLRETRLRLEEERERRRAEALAEHADPAPAAYEEPYYDPYYRSYYPSILAPVAQRAGQQRRTLRGQSRALEETGLTGRRPASINSGEHSARVTRSRALPLAGGRPPRP